MDQNPLVVGCVHGEEGETTTLYTDIKVALSKSLPFMNGENRHKSLIYIRPIFCDSPPTEFLPVELLV